MYTIKQRKPQPHQLPKRLPTILKKVYSNRGLVKEDELNLSINNLLPTNQLHGIDDVAINIIKAIKENKRIVIVGDFDVDGATSSSVMYLGLKQLKAKNVSFLVPNRVTDGYGLSPDVVQQVLDVNGEVIITVDNGISSIEGVNFANVNNINVIVTDHHLEGEVLPEATAIVNPNQKKCDFPSKALAGVGVAFYVILHTLSLLKKENYFQGNNPKIGHLLDLVALGTICDVVPLDKNNRILVEHGLNIIRRGKGRPGINALLEVCGKELEKVSAQDFGFALGPRLNAAGRIADMSIGVELLTTDSPELAKINAVKLNELNNKRKEIEGVMKEEAMKYCEEIVSGDTSLPLGIVLYHENYHQGILGILASRIKEHYFRPTIAFAEDGDYLKGSCRSISMLNIRDVLDDVDKECSGTIVKFGGHAMAAGVTIMKDKLDEFKDGFNRVIKRQLGNQSLSNILYTDGELTASDFTLSTAKLLRDSGPWGQQFPEPVFDNLFLIKEQKIIGEKHLRLALNPIINGKEKAITLNGIYFNIDLDTWPNDNVGVVRVVYKPNVNTFRGKDSLQLMIDYIEPIRS